MNCSARVRYRFCSIVCSIVLPFLSDDIVTREKEKEITSEIFRLLVSGPEFSFFFSYFPRISFEATREKKVKNK